ncbi:MAG: Wzz/FepE/Etk N-terminal domain-containing protein [Candidatus Izemoplasmatales bacterium]|jgi:capsular polysaccharide biosynthesis protein|nr:Wzz/FepE/Etk N-terminal domain-containing protein [Candidatus Izemoplasmatales bacterium]MDD5293894.1 Wzz/FepE/Etk N-terminal domain-containing protein [Candidatus Izemoplasmatales bacterium]
MDEINKEELVVEEGITLQDLLRIVWNNIILIGLVTLWVTVIGIVYTFVIVSPKYTAETAVMVQVNWSESGTSEQSAISIANALMTTYKDFVVSELVLDSVIEDVDAIAGVNAKQLEKMISISSTTGAYMIYVSVEHPSPAIAQEIANKIVENSIAIADDEEQGFLFLQNKLKLVYPAKLPTVPSSPNKVLNVIISALIGGILSLGIVFLKELFNNKFLTKEDLEKHLNLRVIATVPGTIKERKLVE